MTDDDSYLWLEEVEGADALGWVAERNAQTLDALARGPGFDALRREVLEVLDASDRIPYTVRRGAFLYDFWQDAAHPKGVWRRTTLEQYRKDAPEWELLLDVDALGAGEGVEWVWAGARVRRPDWGRALVSLSREGSDAIVVREFDLGTREFVQGGFAVGEAKTSIDWIDADHVYVGTDTGPGSLTEAGYPRTVRRWRRGTALADAEVVFEVATGDVAAAGWRDPTPGFERDFVSRARDFWHDELFLLADDGTPRRVDVPDDAGKYAWKQWLVVTPESPWLGYPAGSLLAFDFEAFLAGDRTASVLFAPDGRTALAGHSWTRHHLVLETLVDVATRIEILTPGPGREWARRPLADVAPLSSAGVTDTDPEVCDEYFLDVDSFLRPSTLYRGEIGGPTEILKRAPAHFDATGMAARQYFATSADGTRVPYFVVGPDTAHDAGSGPRPVLLYGYGGFRDLRTPSYDPVTGRAWLARGGTYAVANIRGGAEYGPAWHRAALGAGRPRAFEDFAAVARDLIDRGLTTPERLGAVGASNGGLLMGAMLTRYPELFGAIVAKVPLLDMLRFHKLPAGASWTGEYGDPDDEADRPHLRDISPYHRLTAGRPYPPLLLMTSTRDDRVHPAHARKTAARLRELGHRVLFYENTGGGHGGATDNAQAAFNHALAHTFLWQHLG
ncbi:prolyl oligopeptidase family protein [Streptomyces sp. A1136]|uniref:prolyl oligopeptidase family serine peptidase n=1 Tax=Streptomyces sp. A1136 TaxID=2563102 RepID=UPI00109E5E0B|nr:prolyl oligopeptidase family serine peptidase [Streptomyces sp. A1136]THA56987.1 S9 family peptidase [Streptomyces sp. A1136]